jgi:hypothetical protein
MSRKIPFNINNKARINITGTFIEMFVEKYTTQGIIQCPSYAEYMIFVASEESPLDVIPLLPGDFQKFAPGSNVYVYTQVHFVGTVVASIEGRHFYDSKFVRKVDAQHRLYCLNSGFGGYNTQGINSALRTTLFLGLTTVFSKLEYAARLSTGNNNSRIYVSITPIENYTTNLGGDVLTFFGNQLIDNCMLNEQIASKELPQHIIIPPGYAVSMDLETTVLATGQFLMGLKTF